MGIAHSSRAAFSEDIFSWAERDWGGEDYLVEKIAKIKACVCYFLSNFYFFNSFYFI